MKNLKKVFVFILGIAVLTGCSNTDSVLHQSLSPEIQKALNAAIEDEFKAQVTYRRILNDFGSQTKPFSNILNAEVKHADALANLLNTYRLSYLPTHSMIRICPLSAPLRMLAQQAPLPKLKTLNCTILF